MATIPQYHGYFTLLYGDPEVREQQQYLQPLYGLTADDDPPTTRHRRELSQDASSSANSSLTSADDPRDDLGQLRGISIPGEPAPRQHKHPRISSGLNPASTGTGNAEDDEGDDGEKSGTPAATWHRRTNTEEREAAAAPDAAAAVAPRPPRTINRAELSLYVDLCTSVVGPQPVFGGVAVQREAHAPNAAASADTSSVSQQHPYLFNATGAPLLSSIVENNSLKRLQEARRPYPAPQPRSGHVLLPCPSRGTLILYGGLGEDPFNDVWEYDTLTGRWEKLHCIAAAESASSSGRHSVAAVPTEHDEQAGDEEAASTAAPNASSSVQPASQAAALQAENINNTGPAPNETLADIIARLQALRPAVSGDSTLSDSEDEADDYNDNNDGEGDNDEEQQQQQNAGAAPSRHVPRHPNKNMPPPAYGQAASLYVDDNGDTCMAVLGGITVGDVCAHGFFSLNLVTLTWRRLETTMRTTDMWGATAQTLYAPRRYPRSSPPLPTNGDGISNEEQVVVLFGGMTAMGEVINPITHILHLDHPLTADEIAASPTLFLDSIDYAKREETRVRRHVMREEDAMAKALNEAPMDDSQTTSIEERCARWRLAHADLLTRWRQRTLRNMEGKYWAEALPATDGLHGRRRPTSAAFQRHFMYIFGGRDEVFFYNDLWCLNIVTRTWVQVRDGVPAHLLRRFLANPYNPRFSALLSERGAKLRRRLVAAVEAKFAQNPSTSMSAMVRNRDIHHALYSSSVNSTARARTGACMVADVRRGCLYLYGGFSYTGQQHLTFFDLHAYYINDNVWRRMSICHERPWISALDAAQDAVNLVDPCEEARPYPRHAQPVRPLSSGGGPRQVSTSSSLPLTLMGYATRHLRPSGTAPSDIANMTGNVSSVCPPDRGPAPLIVRRGQREILNTHTSDNNSAAKPDQPTAPQKRVNATDFFHLPTFIPEGRTMAAMAEDPRHPGTRFFLHGGRSGEEACGDFFELRTAVSRTVDVEYAKTQRAARLEGQTEAANTVEAAAASRAGSLPSSVVDTAAQATNPAAAPALDPAAPLPSASTAAASGSAADANRLRLRNRRQLQRQLISAALEEEEEFEDAPAAHAATVAQTASVPRHSLRDRAAMWIRDGLAAADPKSLMFVELRNGHAVVNLRTHIHYSSRLSLLEASKSDQQQQQRTEDSISASRHSATGAAATATAALTTVTTTAITTAAYPASTAIAGHDPSLSSSTTQQQMDSHDDHLKRSALSLEILLYDVLLSKPICNAVNGGEGTTMTSPCTHSVVPSTSSENPHATALPSCPLVSGSSTSPGTSPGAAPPLPRSSHVQIVSRAHYSTPRTPQPLSIPAGTNPQQPQQRQLENSDARAQVHHVPSPALTLRNSSLCNKNSAGFQQQPTSNEYDYHILLRSLFYNEPYCKTFGTSEKKR